MYASGAEQELEELLKQMRNYGQANTPAGITSDYLFDNVKTRDMYKAQSKKMYGGGMNHTDGYKFSNKSVMNSYGKGDTMAKGLYGRKTTGNLYGRSISYRAGKRAYGRRGSGGASKGSYSSKGSSKGSSGGK